MGAVVYPLVGGPVAGVASLPAVEAEVLTREATGNTFRRSVQQRSGCQAWVFYDGPPFANGLPHYGHLLTGYVKDVYPRFQTMLGKHVERRFGWDTHGLPAELEAMRVLNMTQKAEVEAYGIHEFNQVAQRQVLKYVDDWERYVVRQNRWVDFKGGYKTLDMSYMESELWAFKQLFDKGLAYEGLRVVPYCWQDETPLSNHEMQLDDAYRDREDTSVTVAFTLAGDRATDLGLADARMLAWTTTPWTLSANLLLAVNPDLEYVVAQSQFGKVVLAASAVERYTATLGYVDVVTTLRGSDLSGVAYLPLYKGLADTANAFKVVTDGFVTAETGTGVVHLAPAYGVDDQRVSADNGVPVKLTLDDGGRFTSVVPDLVGRHWFDVTADVLEYLRGQQALVESHVMTHSYPHCWRCRQPLLFKAVTAWFVSTTKLKDRMVALSDQVDWQPEYVGKMMTNWLSNTQDWNVSRNRYWGTPLPVWRSDDPRYPRVEVYGSVAELESAFGVPVQNLHREYLDALVRPNPDDPTGRSMMRRVNDVFDVWFDSASMPFAQQHYPFENRDTFDASHPADFVVEYVGQVRGWFYVMHVLSTALFDRPAFKHVLSHGVVLGDDGKKMSKSLHNYPDVYLMFDKYGSDAMRWFLLSSAVSRGGNLSVKEEALRNSMKDFLHPLWNTYNFFVSNANAYQVAGHTSHSSTQLLDAHLLGLTGELVAGVRAALTDFDNALACKLLTEFMEKLTNWYVRGSRKRFQEQDQAAYDTLYTVLCTVVRAAAPLAPLTCDAVWVGLTGADSVHLTDYPGDDMFPRSVDTMEQVALADEMVEAGNRLRKQHRLRTRLPLTRLTVLTQASVADTTKAFVMAELNVHQVNVVNEDTVNMFELATVLQVQPKLLGPRLGSQVQQVLRAAKTGNWRQSTDGVLAGGVLLLPEEYTLSYQTAREDVTGLVTAGFALLDTSVTQGQLLEGLFRDTLHEMQNLRKSAGFNVGETRGNVTVFGNADVETMFSAYHTQLVAQGHFVAVTYLQAKDFGVTFAKDSGEV